MSDGKCTDDCPSGRVKSVNRGAIQRILIFQQDGSGASKTKGIKMHGKGSFFIQQVSIDEKLPALLDDTAGYLPGEIQADLVLDFLKHPDLSHDLAVTCRNSKIPIVASGKKLRVKWALTPPT